ncbi:MAG: hypothetical protein HKN76_12505 [Saprospiraceae bacterium]|nr:hypothetical protein [Saprospiraceae bacterium]
MRARSGWRKKDSRSYLTDPSAVACWASDQRSMVKHIIKYIFKENCFYHEWGN